MYFGKVLLNSIPLYNRIKEYGEIHATKVIQLEQIINKLKEAEERRLIKYKLEFLKKKAVTNHINLVTAFILFPLGSIIGSNDTIWSNDTCLIH